MKKVIIIFGTRPEAIKLAPLIKEFKKYPKHFDTKVCVTAQHREMLDQVLDFFEIVPDYDLNLMKPDQSLIKLTGEMFKGLHSVFEEYNPDLVVVQGDTSSTMVGGVAGFYAGAKVCHIEAGLRTYNKEAPFPEEGNRCIVSQISSLHFTPTQQSANNLLKEGVDNSSIMVTGNTVIDALLDSVAKVNNIKNDEIDSLKKKIVSGLDIVLVTGHRRENIGEGFRNICFAIKEIINSCPVQVIFPVHLNPNVRKTVFDVLGGTENIHLIDPLSYPAFVWLMERSKIILSDSGGVQEEAPSLGKPVLVLRDTTERPEAVDAGTVKLVGTSKNLIVSEAKKLLSDSEYYKKVSVLKNPYGSGNASKKIVDFVKIKYVD